MYNCNSLTADRICYWAATSTMGYYVFLSRSRTR